MANVTAPLLVADPRIQTMYAMGSAGGAHQHLAPLAGDWNVIMHMFPGTGVTVASSGIKSRKRPILDGRQIWEEIYEGTIAGLPHRKFTMLGYNNVNQRYEFVTADNLDTQQMVYRGDLDSATGAITLEDLTHRQLTPIS